MHVAIFESVGVWKDGIGFRCVRHVFLDTKVVNAEIEMKCSGHADGAQVGGAVWTHADVIEFSEIGDSFQLSDAAGMKDGRADVVTSCP